MKEFVIGLVVGYAVGFLATHAMRWLRLGIGVSNAIKAAIREIEDEKEEFLEYMKGGSK